MALPKLNPRWAAWLALVAATAVLSYLGLAPTPVPPPPVEPPFAFGWVDDPKAREAAAVGKPEFASTPAGRAALAADTAYLWKAVEECWAKYPARDSRPYPNEDQKSVGCCVGVAQKHVLDALSAVEIVQNREPQEWKPTAVEFVYAAGRIDIGRGQVRGDGSLGAWSAAAVEKLGTCPMEVIESNDLTHFDPMRARTWGQTGIPGGVKGAFAGKHTGTAARVRSWADAQRAVLQGYPVMLCSEQAFRMTRDAAGFCPPDSSNRWPHAMALLGVRSGDRPGGFILNSWGDSAHAGPRGAGDPPRAGFWADAAVIDRMCASGDCWAFSQFAGFPARHLDWYAGVKQTRSPTNPEVLRARAALAIAFAK